LAMEIWNAGRDLIRQRLSILGGTAFYNVRDVHRITGNFNSLQDPVE